MNILTQNSHFENKQTKAENKRANFNEVLSNLQALNQIKFLIEKKNVH